MFSRQISIGTISFTCLILLGGPYDLILSGGSYDQVQQLANLQSSALLTRHNSALLIAYPGLHPTRVSCAVARYTLREHLCFRHGIVLLLAQISMAESQIRRFYLGG